MIFNTSTVDGEDTSTSRSTEQHEGMLDNISEGAYYS